MLHGILIAVGVVSLFGGLIALITGAFPPAMIAFVWGILLIVGTAFERVIYKKAQREAPGAGWLRTTERFIDDATGEHITVYVEPQSGERRYVKD